MAPKNRQSVNVTYDLSDLKIKTTRYINPLKEKCYKHSKDFNKKKIKLPDKKTR